MNEVKQMLSTQIEAITEQNKQLIATEIEQLKGAQQMPKKKILKKNSRAPSVMLAGSQS